MTVHRTRDGWRNRIIGHGEEVPDQLLANPLNCGGFAYNSMHEPGAKVLPVLPAALAARCIWIKVGIVPPVRIEGSGHLVDGHARVMLADRNGETEILAVWVDLSEEEESLILATLDPLAAMAGVDAEKLDELLREVSTGDTALQAMLADLAESAGILNKPTVAEDPGAQIDRAEELRQKWGTERGQLWEIGRHRLLCGDSTSTDDVARLVGGERAGAVVTDPPYGIDQPGITNDDPAGLRLLFDGCLSAMPVDDAAIIAFQSTRMFPVWLDAIRAAGHDFERMLWMYKPNDVTFPWRGWLLKSEAILVSTVGEASWLRVDPFAHDCYTSNWDSETKAKIDGWHASIKPLPLIQDLVSRVGGLVYEPFSGSGTTLVACERLSRDCRAIELEPKYVAVALERLSGMGLTPRLSDG